MKLYVKTLNGLTFFVNNNQVYLPYKKVEALFLYLIYNEKSDRDFLVNLFWPDSIDSVGKKNLRNCIYKIRKTFGKNIIVTPNKSKVMINDEYNIESDFKEIKNDNSKILELYDGEFLKGFFLKGENNFRDWLDQKKFYYKNLFVNQGYNKLLNNLNTEENNIIEDLSKKLIEEDEYDERIYRLLIKHYVNNNKTNKAIQVYKELEKKLKDELLIEPDIESKELYAQIKKIKINAKINSNKELNILCRDRVLDDISDYFKEKYHPNFIILGEAGVGKTMMANYIKSIFQKNSFHIVKSNCYEIEESYFLKPWNPILSKLQKIIEKQEVKNIQYSIDDLDKFTNLDINSIYSIMLEILKGIKKPICIYFEDIQWMDKKSLNLLNLLIKNSNISNLSFIITLRNNKSNAIRVIDNWANRLNAKKISLNPFDKEEMEEFIYSYNKLKLDNNFLNDLYLETQGNPFFLSEFLKVLKDDKDINEARNNIKDILKSRFLNITQEEERILELISFFFDRVSLDLLIKVLNKDEYELVMIIESLINKGFIKELNKEDKIYYSFTHYMLREYIYNNISLGKRKIIHQKIGDILESKLKGINRDVFTYSKLIYHYEKGFNFKKLLKYKIKNLSYYLDFSHEEFPIVLEDVNKIDFSSILDKDIKKEFEEINKIFEEKLNDIDYLNIDMIIEKIVFINLKSRYYIRLGDYNNGNKLLKKSIIILDTNKDLIESSLYKKLKINCVKQYIYYGIQKNDIKIMKKGLDEYKKNIYKDDLNGERGVFFRLNGLYKMKIRDYKLAEEYFNQAIKYFKNLQKKNKLNKNEYLLLNLAPVYNYLGEIKEASSFNKSALEYYNKAIEISLKFNYHKGVNIYYLNAGKAYYNIGDYENSYIYLEKSYEYYKKNKGIWKLSIVLSLLALLEYKKNKFDISKKYLLEAHNLSKIIDNPYEIALNNRVNLELFIIEKSKKNNFLSSLLKEDEEYYRSLSISNFEKLGLKREIEEVKSLISS